MHPAARLAGSTGPIQLLSMGLPTVALGILPYVLLSTPVYALVLIAVYILCNWHPQWIIATRTLEPSQLWAPKIGSDLLVKRNLCGSPSQNLSYSGDWQLCSQIDQILMKIAYNGQLRRGKVILVSLAWHHLWSKQEKSQKCLQDPALAWWDY